MYRGADNGALFRSHDLCGLGLTSVSHYFCKMQVIKCSLLDNSADPNVRMVYKHKSMKSSVWTVKWNARKIYQDLSAEVLLRSKFPTQPSKRLGLGHDLFQGNPSKDDIRKLLSTTLSEVEVQKHFAHSVQLERQNVA